MQYNSELREMHVLDHRKHMCRREAGRQINVRRDIPIREGSITQFAVN